MRPQSVAGRFDFRTPSKQELDSQLDVPRRIAARRVLDDGTKARTVDVVAELRCRKPEGVHGIERFCTKLDTRLLGDPRAFVGWRYPPSGEYRVGAADRMSA
jgi:hypothetical protein